MAVRSPVSCTAGGLEALWSVVSTQESQDPPVRTPVPPALGPFITVKPLCSQGLVFWGAWLALWVGHATPDLGVMSSSPTMGVEPTLNKQTNKHPQDWSYVGVTRGPLFL